MKKLGVVTAIVLSGVLQAPAQNDVSDTFKVYKPDVVSYNRIGLAATGDEAVLTYGTAEEVDGVTEYWFGVHYPVVAPEKFVPYDSDKAMPVSVIGSYAMQNTAIESFFSGNSVKVLYDCALHLPAASDDVVARLTLGSSVEKLCHRAVVCDGPTMLVVAAAVPPVWTDDESVVFDNAAGSIVVVPDGSVEAYKADARWSGIGDIHAFSEFGLDLFKDSGYVTYRVCKPDLLIDRAGYAVEDGCAVLTYSMMFEPDCEFCETDYSFDAVGDFVTPRMIEHDGKSYEVKAIGSFAVTDYNNLESFDTGDKVEVLLDNAVCSSSIKPMKSIRLGASVKVIGHQGLRLDPEKPVEQLIVAAAVPPAWASPDAVYGCDLESVTLVVPDESVDAYRSHPWWSKFANVHPFSEFGYLGVNQIDADARTSYFNLKGIPVELPSDGLYIKVEDGKSSKVRF